LFFLKKLPSTKIMAVWGKVKDFRQEKMAGNYQGKLRFTCHLLRVIRLRRLWVICCASLASCYWLSFGFASLRHLLSLDLDSPNPDKLEPKKQKRTQRRRDAKLPQSFFFCFSLACGGAGFA